MARLEGLDWMWSIVRFGLKGKFQHQIVKRVEIEELDWVTVIRCRRFGTKYMVKISSNELGVDRSFVALFLKYKIG